MRQLTFFFCFISLLSCSTDKIETLFNDNNSFKSEDSEHLETEMTKEYNFQNYSFSSEKRSSQDIQNEILKDLSSSQKAIASNLHGPFTITVPVPNPNPTNVRVIYNKEHPPAVGTYITDVYNYKIKLQLPSNAVVGYVESVQTEGYSDYRNQTMGFNFHLSNENGILYLNANTYTMILKQTLLGQWINIIKPEPSGPKTFTYYYFTP